MVKRVKKSKKRKINQNKIDERNNEKEENKISEQRYKSENKVIIYTILAILFLLVLISIYWIFTGSEENTYYQNNSNKTIEINSAKNSEYVDVRNCLKKIGIYEKVVFLYKQDCAFSIQNIQYIKELIAEGYSIKMFDITNTTEFIQFYNCISKEFEIQGTPTFICVNNISKKEEPFASKLEIINYINNC